MEVSWENHRTKWMGWEFPELAMGPWRFSSLGESSTVANLSGRFSRGVIRAESGEAMSTVQD